MTARTKPLVIAIDGPSGSGKSSVSRAVAQRLDLAYLDTGAMFRALTWWCAQTGVNLDDQSAVAGAARDLPLQMGTDPSSPSVWVGGVVIDEAIRTSEISESVSKVATNLEVRAELRDRQRALIADSVENSGGVVAEGRDITTVVAPHADVRILLVANQKARLARRAKELHGDSDHAAVDATHDQISTSRSDDVAVVQALELLNGEEFNRRVALGTLDQELSQEPEWPRIVTRAYWATLGRAPTPKELGAGNQFMQAAPGVTLVDNSDLDFEQSVDAVLGIVATRTGCKA